MTRTYHCGAALGGLRTQIFAQLAVLFPNVPAIEVIITQVPNVLDVVAFKGYTARVIDMTVFRTVLASPLASNGSLALDGLLDTTTLMAQGRLNDPVPPDDPDRVQEAPQAVPRHGNKGKRRLPLGPAERESKQRMTRKHTARSRNINEDRARDRIGNEDGEYGQIIRYSPELHPVQYLSPIQYDREWLDRLQGNGLQMRESPTARPVKMENGLVRDVNHQGPAATTEDQDQAVREYIRLRDMAAEYNNQMRTAREKAGLVDEMDLPAFYPVQVLEGSPDVA